jgi:hypothetical protein
MSHAAPPKPIRFVNSHEQYAKRRRINTACLTCRRKKTRCSGERPACLTCQSNKHQCAGYGEDSAAGPSTSTSTSDAGDSKRRPPRDGAAPPQKQPAPPAPPIDPQLTRPPAARAFATASQRPGATAHRHAPKHDRDRDRGGSHGALSLSTRNRMPYFRYFGPTAIMPGFKQMVVKVLGTQHGSGHTTSDRTPSTRPVWPY